MNSEEIDKEFSMNIAHTMFDNGYTLDQYMEIVCGNEYLHTDTIAYIRKHAELAMKIINTAKRKNERKAKEESEPEQCSQENKG